MTPIPTYVDKGWWVVGWLVGRIVGYFGWLTSRLVGWSVGRSVGWSVSWSVGRSGCSLTPFTCSGWISRYDPGRWDVAPTATADAGRLSPWQQPRCTHRGDAHTIATTAHRGRYTPSRGIRCFASTPYVPHREHTLTIAPLERDSASPRALPLLFLQDLQVSLV